MEGMRSTLNRDGEAYMATLLRRQSSNPPPLPNFGMGLEDLDSVFGPQIFTDTRQSSPRKPNFTRGHSRAKSYHDSDEESGESDDELDFLSQHSSQASPVPKAKASSKKKYVDPAGKEHEYHPNHHPTKEKRLKNLSFKKNPQTRVEQPATRLAKENRYSSPLSSPSRSSRPLRDRSPNHDATPRQRPPPVTESSTPKPTRPKPRPTFKKQTTFLSPKKHSRDSSSSEDERQFEKKRPEKQARQISHLSKLSPLENSQSPPKKQRVRRTVSKVNYSEADDEGDDSDVLVETQPATPKNKRKGKQKAALGIASFPMPPPDSILGMSSLSLDKQDNRITQFPNLSPLKDPRSDLSDHCPDDRGIAPFPMDSPLSSQKASKSDQTPDRMSAGSTLQRKKSKKNLGTAKEKEKTDVKQKKQKIRPFPMELTQRPDASPSVSPMKRSSSDFEEGGSARKKKRASEFISSIKLKDDTHLFLDPNVNPDTLCPFCDEQLPKNPTVFFKNLLQTVKSKSTRDSRPTNPHGLRAPIGIFAELCQRHRFESELLPLAELKGWPRSIKWGELEKRIQKMENYLTSLINDSGSATMAEDSDIEFPDEDSGPRGKSYFWQEAMKDVKQKGSNVVAGVRGQYHTFEKTQPGYYGEKGSIIIHQALYILFSPSSLDPALLKPFSPAEFIQRILVPEVALRLIMDDRHLSWPDDIEEGITVMRESAAYGVGMFREDDGEVSVGGKKAKKGVSVADQMMMNTADRRRKELEKEDEDEDRKMDDSDTYVQPAEKKTKKRRRVQKAAEVTDVEDPPKLPRPKPRALFKADVNTTDGGQTTDVDNAPLVGASSSQIVLNKKSPDTKGPGDRGSRIKKPNPAVGSTRPRPKPAFKARATTDEDTFGDATVDTLSNPSAPPTVSYETESTQPVSPVSTDNERVKAQTKTKNLSRKATTNTRKRANTPTAIESSTSDADLNGVTQMTQSTISVPSSKPPSSSTLPSLPSTRSHEKDDAVRPRAPPGQQKKTGILLKLHNWRENGSKAETGSSRASQSTEDWTYNMRGQKAPTTKKGGKDKNPKWLLSDDDDDSQSQSQEYR